jgi:hypothetical protein
MLFVVPLFSLAFAAPVSADSSGAVASTFTQTFTDVTTSFRTGLPCTGQVGTATLTFNAVFHVTVLTLGPDTGSSTFTQEAALTFVTDGGVTYTGRVADWDGESVNIQNGAATFTFVIHATGSDGSSFTFHVVGHITLLGNPPTSIAVSFTFATCSS